MPQYMYAGLVTYSDSNSYSTSHSHTTTVHCNVQQYFISGITSTKHVQYWYILNSTNMRQPIRHVVTTSVCTCSSYNKIVVAIIIQRTSARHVYKYISTLVQGPGKTRAWVRRVSSSAIFDFNLDKCKHIQTDHLHIMET